MVDLKQNKEKVTWKGWMALIVLVVLFSGVFQNSTTFLKALDFNNLGGALGTIQVPNTVVNEEGVAEIVLNEKGEISNTKYNFQGKGGSGARDGIMVALGLLPMIAFASGLIEWAQSMGAMVAAERIFRPILRKVYGIPGTCGIAYVSSFTSSDVASLMTRNLREAGEITEDERTIFVAYQYPATAVIGNTVGTQAALLPFIATSAGVVIVVLWICKTLGANLVRFLIFMENKRKNRG